jgi:hypothetical protein
VAAGSASRERIDRGGNAELRKDGAVVFGGGCLILKPTEDDKLKLTIQPTKCGELQGKVLLDYLVKTAGKGVIIEIPPAEEEPVTKVKPKVKEEK